MENLQRSQIPNDVVMKYIKLYKSIGINSHNHETLQGDYEVMVRQTVRNDTYYFAKLFDVNITDARFKSLIFKGVKPKNKQELLVQNLQNAFIKIHDETSSFELLVTEVHDLMKFLYDDILSSSKTQFRKIVRKDRNINLLNSRYSSTRESIDHLIKLFNDAVASEKYEVSYIIANFYIDFINIKPFVDKNEEIGMILLYILLVANGYEVFEYISFMEKVYKSKDTFENVVLQSSFNWEVGYAQILPLHNFVLNIALDSYQTLNYLVRDYEFDQQLNKSNNVENTIMKLEDTFSKDDIRNVHPYISDSTINRTLKRLRDDGVIRPLGKGRSAKWIKLVKTENKKIKFEQLDLNI
jgi:Fic family protein